MASAVANMALSGNVITTGSNAVNLTPGSFSCAGTSYNFQSASLVADGGISGTRSFDIAATDVAGNRSTTSWSVRVDGTSPGPTGLVTTNVAGGSAGHIDTGDSFSVTMSEATIDLPRISAGWSGGPLAVFLRVFNNNAVFGGNDGVAICRALTDCQPTGAGADNLLGTLNLGTSPFVATVSTFNGTLTWDATTRTFRASFGGCGAPPCATPGRVLPSTATFTPLNGATRAGGIRDTAGNGVVGTASSTGLQL
jgi:hypothetical protein